MKKEVYRTCIACREKKTKINMYRIVKNKNNEINIDKKNEKLQGRGCYVCKTSDCIEKVIAKKLLHKQFSMNIDNSVYQKLKSLI